jgi:hypothetical protein
MEAVTTPADVDTAEARLARREGRIDPGIFLGSWISTNRETQGIVRLTIREEDGTLLVRAFGATTPAPCDWGEVRAMVFADGPDTTRARAFTARFDFGFKETSLQAKEKKGVLVVANFNRFKDGSGRANFFSREFFHRAPAAAGRDD